MLEINTNNHIEAWHNILKSRYLGSCRKQRTDILVHLLLREVLPDYRINVARLKMGMTHFVGMWTGENMNTVSLIHSKHVALRDLYLETALKWESAQRFVLDICLVVRIRLRVDPQRQRFSLQTRPLPPLGSRPPTNGCTKSIARRLRAAACTTLPLRPSIALLSC